MPNDLPRNEDLPLFDPHRPDFTCQIEASKVPPIDAQADEWFLQARALEDPEIFEDERDYKKIVQLTRQAAERHHWKAMLNLASLYLEGRDPAHGAEDAIRLVEQAMRLGIPAAYDRMGTYHMNGIVPGDATRAYAFFQRAADMGNPQAMTFLGEKLQATWDNPREGFWANLPVAIRMLECAFGQGYGEAAYYLNFEYAPTGKATREGKARALRVLHEGVKLGCSLCAARLAINFAGAEDLTDMLVPFIDKARAERYAVLDDALRFNPHRRFPNLDKVLPLPPAPLPRWDGKRETLLKAAMAVTPPRATPKPSAASQRPGRERLDAAYDFRASDDKTNETYAPFAGYWRPTAPDESELVREYLASFSPRLYQPGDAFDQPRYPPDAGRGPIPGVIWQRMLTVYHNHGSVEPRATASLSREIARPEPHLSYAANDPCPVTGTWQPWIDPDHPLCHAVNQPWRQTWLGVGQPFPHPQRDWLLLVDPSELTWHLLDSTVLKLESDKEQA